MPRATRLAISAASDRVAYVRGRLPIHPPDPPFARGGKESLANVFPPLAKGGLGGVMSGLCNVSETRARKNPAPDDPRCRNWHSHHATARMGGISTVVYLHENARPPTAADAHS